MSFRRLSSLLTGLLCAVIASTASATATTIVPMSDRDLALSARAVVEGTVVAAEPLWDARCRAVFTYVTVDVERTYKGDLPVGLVVLKQRGGVTKRHTTTVHGAPQFAPGHRVLLFLNTDRDGALRVAHVALGHYRIFVDAEGREVAERSIETATLLPRDAGATVTDRALKADLVAAAVAAISAAPHEAALYEERYAGVPLRVAPPEYAAARSTGGSTHAEFGFLNPGYRWFEPDHGDAVAVSVNPRFGPTPSKGVDEVKAALAAWSSVSGSSLRLSYGGQTNAAGRIEDGVTSITFGDPEGELDDPVNCSGVVAVGGVTKATGEWIAIGGKRFGRILEGDVVFNNGFDCLLSSCEALSEIATHEVGHVVGFGHSSERHNEPNERYRDATMYYSAHIDGRGASLRADDVEAARFLYPSESAATPLEIVTVELPEASAGARFEFYLQTRGGASPVVWSIASGTLPRGLRLTQDGHLCGTIEAEAYEVVALRARDAEGVERVAVFTVRAAASPAPFLTRAVYKPSRGKLTIAGLRLSADAAILINGEELADRSRVRFKAKKSKLVVRGSSEALQLRAEGQNTISVVVDGRESNALTF